MRHGDVAYFDEDGRPVDPRTYHSPTKAGAQSAAAAEALAAFELRPGPHERPAAHARDRADRRPAHRARVLAGSARAARRPPRGHPGGRARVRVRRTPSATSSRRRRVSSAARPSGSSSTACCQQSSACSPTRSGTSRSPSCTAASTAPSSPARLPAAAPSSATSSSRRPASTSWTWARTGSCARSTLRRTIRAPAQPSDDDGGAVDQFREHVEHDAMVELIRRDFDPAELDEIRELWKRHSKAEDNRDLPGLISTLTEDCVYELRSPATAGRATRARPASTRSCSRPFPTSTST